MNKKILEDIKIKVDKKIPQVSKEKFLFRNKKKEIKQDSTFSNSSKYEFLKKKNKFLNQRISQTPVMPPKRRAFNKTILFCFFASILVGIFYLLSTTFFKVNIIIVPKIKSFEVKHQEFNAIKNKNEGIPFEIMIDEDKEYKDLILTSSTEVSKKAKGEVILYNEYSNKPEKITAGTFLSDENGIAYKTDSTVTIPPYILEKSKKIIPGQVSVKITSFLPGDKYNGSPEYFYIDSFKGTNKHKKIYAKIKYPLEGGIAGLVYFLDDTQKTSILSKTVAFKEKLLRKLYAQIPEGYILFPDAVKFSYEIESEVVSKTPEARIEIVGVVSAVLLKEKELSDSLVNKLLPKISPKERLEIVQPDLSALFFNFKNKEQIINKDTDSFSFGLTGNLEIKWRPNIDELKVLLSGLNKNEVHYVFKSDPGISSADVKIIPFWLKKLPEDLKKINIVFK